MSIETVCPKCDEEYDARHPYCPACRYCKREKRVLTREEAKKVQQESDDEC